MTTFSEISTLNGEIFREQPGRKTFKFYKDNQAYFAKIHYGVGWTEIIKNLIQFKLPVLGAKNEVTALQKLAKFNFTPELIDYGWEGKNPATQKSFVIMRALENTISLEDYCRNWKTNPPEPKHKWDLIKQVAEITKTIHDNGINHRDFYICHFLLNTQTGKLTVIDWHRAQCRENVPERWKIKDVAGLLFSSMDIGLSKKDFQRFTQYYTDAKNPEFCKKVMVRAIKLYRKIHKRGPELLEHLK